MGSAFQSDVARVGAPTAPADRLPVTSALFVMTYLGITVPVSASADSRRSHR